MDPRPIEPARRGGPCRARPTPLSSGRARSRRRIAGLLLFALLTSVFSGCGRVNGALSDVVEGAQYRVVVSGTPGTPFTGMQTTGAVAGDWSAQSVEGTVPAEYQLRGNLVALVLQKDDDAGTVRAQLFRGADLIKDVQTSTPLDTIEVAEWITEDQPTPERARTGAGA